MNKQEPDYTKIASAALVIAMIVLLAVVLFKVPEKIDREKKQDNLINSLSATDKNVEELTQKVLIMERQINGLDTHVGSLEKNTFEIVQRVDNIVIKTYEPTATCIFSDDNESDSFVMSCIKNRK